MSASPRHSAIVSQGRAVESRTRRASDRPLGGIAGEGDSVVNGSRMLAPMLSASHFLTHIALGFLLANLWPATRRDQLPVDLRDPRPSVGVSLPGAHRIGARFNNQWAFWLDTARAGAGRLPVASSPGIDTTKV